MNIRPLTAVDIDAVLPIEHAAHAFPWTRAMLESGFKEGHRFLGLEVDGQLAAFLVWMQILDECHILNVATAPAFQRRGLARALMEHLRAEARRAGAQFFFLEVRASNQAAIRLYEQQGFNEMGRRRNYYPAVNGREDAILMGGAT